jgi:hypothetical protein
MHEDVGMKYQKDDDLKMDLKNNEIGTSIGFVSQSDEEAQGRCLRAAQKGRLVTLNSK